MIRLPFNLDMNAPLSKVIYQPSFNRKKTNISISLPNSLSRIIKSKIKDALFNIKLEATKILPVKKISNLNSKIFIRKLKFLNMRINSRLKDIFYDLKMYHISCKRRQQQNLQKTGKQQVFQFVLPLIQERIAMYAWRKLVKFAKLIQNKQKLAIQSLRITQKLIKRKIYSSAFLMIQLASQTQAKKGMALSKIFSRLKQKQQFDLQYGYRKIQIYWRYMDLQQIHDQKRQKINKIYDVNAQRGNMLQNQRQTLRNLKYKLDYDSVQKNHIITDKRRQIMLTKSKFNEQSKQLQQQIKLLQSQTSILESKVNKQKQACQLLQSNKENIKNLNYEKISKGLYKVINDMFTDGKLSTLLQLLKNYQQKIGSSLGVLLEQIKNQPQYQLKLINVLQMLIKFYQKKDDPSPLSKSKASSLGTSKIGLAANTSNNINGSRFSNIAPIIKKTQQSEYQRANDQNKAISELIQFFMEKEYDSSMDNLNLE